MLSAMPVGVECIPWTNMGKLQLIQAPAENRMHNDAEMYTLNGTNSSTVD